MYWKSVLVARAERPVGGPSTELTSEVLKLRVIVTAFPRLGERSTVLRPRMRLVKRDWKIGRSGEVKVAVSVIVSPEQRNLLDETDMNRDQEELTKEVSLGLVGNHLAGHGSGSGVEPVAEFELERAVRHVGGSDKGIGREHFAVAVVVGGVGHAASVKVEGVRAADVAAIAELDANGAVLIAKVVGSKRTDPGGLDASGCVVRVDGDGSETGAGKADRSVGGVVEGEVVGPSG